MLGPNTCRTEACDGDLLVTDELKKRLLEDVVIFSGKQEVQTGAEALVPDHSPRERYRARPLPARSAAGVEAE